MTLGMTPRSATSTACYAVNADCDPTTVPAIAAVLAKRGLVPNRWYSSLGGRRNDELQIDFQVTDLAWADATAIAQCLRRLVCVEAVLLSEK